MISTFDVKLDRILSRLIIEDKHQYSSTQINIKDKALCNRILAFGKEIPNNYLADDGRETKCHITCKFGLHTNSYDEVKEAVDGFKTFTITLGKTSTFPPKETGDESFEVLNIDVKSPQLHKLNKLLADKLECTDTHPHYNPHLTIAYLKPGKAKTYIDDDRFEGEEIYVDSIVFSNRDRKHHIIKLKE